MPANPPEAAVAADAHWAEKLARLRAKKPVERTLEIRVDGDDQPPVTLTFRALPRPDYERLQAAHPPSDADRAQGKAYNVETFAPALLAASSTDGMTLTDAEDICRTWNLAEVSMLFGAAVSVNETARVTLAGS